MKIVWSPQSVRDLAAVHAFIARDDPMAARKTVGRIVALVDERLGNLPELGRPGRVDGTRELIVPATPFFIPYRVKQDRIEIARIYHSARRWPDAF